MIFRVVSVSDTVQSPMAVHFTTVLIFLASVGFVTVSVFLIKFSAPITYSEKLVTMSAASVRLAP